MVNVQKILMKNGFKIYNYGRYENNTDAIIMSEGIRMCSHGWFDIVLIKCAYKNDLEAIEQILTNEGYIIREEKFGYIEIDWDRYFDCEKFENRLS